jgi:DnaJ family protein C protein 3
MQVKLSALALAASLLSTSSLVYGLSASDIPADTPVSQLLSSAQGHLSKGQTSEALVYYDAAIARDPTNYLTFFKRATTYLSLGRASQATDDFNKVLSLKPGFEGAHLQLGKIKARSADWDAAREQYLLAKKTPASEEFIDLEAAQGAATLAESAENQGSWDECVNYASAAIMVASRALSLREMRTRCRFAKGEVLEGMSDLHHVLQMKPGDTSPHVTISAITSYLVGDLEGGMAQARKCLHSDPESKICKKLLKQEKSIHKTLEKVTKALEKNQPMTAVKQLVQSGEDEGLIKEVQDQIQALQADGTIPKTARSALVSTLLEMACRAYYDVSSFHLAIRR